MVGWYDATPEKYYEMIDIICVIRDTGSLSEGEKNGREHEQLKQLIVNNYPFKRSSNACHSWFLFFSQVEILTRIKDPATRSTGLISIVVPCLSAALHDWHIFGDVWLEN